MFSLVDWTNNQRPTPGISQFCQLLKKGSRAKVDRNPGSHKPEKIIHFTLPSSFINMIICVNFHSCSDHHHIALKMVQLEITDFFLCYGNAHWIVNSHPDEQGSANVVRLWRQSTSNYLLKVVDFGVSMMSEELITPWLREKVSWKQKIFLNLFSLDQIQNIDISDIKSHRKLVAHSLAYSNTEKYFHIQRWFLTHRKFDTWSQSRNTIQQLFLLFKKRFVSLWVYCTCVHVLW